MLIKGRKQKYLMLTLSSAAMVVLLFSFKPHKSVAYSEIRQLTLYQQLEKPVARIEGVWIDTDSRFTKSISWLGISNIPCRNIGRCQNLLEELANALVDIAKWWKDYSESCSKYIPYCKEVVELIPFILILGGVGYVLIYAICNNSNPKP